MLVALWSGSSRESNPPPPLFRYRRFFDRNDPVERASIGIAVRARRFHSPPHLTSARLLACRPSVLIVRSTPARRLRDRLRPSPSGLRHAERREWLRAARHDDGDADDHGLLPQDQRLSFRMLTWRRGGYRIAPGRQARVLRSQRPPHRFVEVTQ